MPSLPVIFCLGYKDWYMDHLVRCLDSIRRHTDAPIYVTDMWSRAGRAVKSIVEDFRALYIKPKEPTPVWSRSVALNLAANRASKGALQECRAYVFTDADMIFPESWFWHVAKLFSETSAEHIYLTHSRDLPPDQTANLPLPWMPPAKDYNLYRASATHPSIGQGAAMIVPVRWFRSVGGFDEEYAVWGAEDNDLVLRARWAGVPVDWLEPEMEAWVVHQYHNRTWPTEEQFKQVKRNREYLAQRELEQGPIIRNRKEGVAQ